MKKIISSILLVFFLYANGNGQSFGLSSFIGVNTDTDTDVRVLNPVDTIYNFSGTFQSIRVSTFGSVGSVKFILQRVGGSTYNRTENDAPFSLGGDTNGDYASIAITAGEYTLTAIPYAQKNLQGLAGTPLVMELIMLNDSHVGEVTSFTALNLVTSQLILLNSEDTIYTDEPVQIRANIENPVRSVDLRVNSFYQFTENEFPYTINHTFDEEGIYLISATPYSEKFEFGFKGETKTMSLTVLSREAARFSFSGYSSGADQNIVLFPNPVKDFLTISNTSASPESIHIFNAMGTEIFSQRYTQDNEKVNVSQLPDGVYYVMIKSDTGTNIKKFLKKN